MSGESNNQTGVSYLRVSGRGQVNGDGFDRQREAVNRYAQAHGIDIVEEFRDEGVCGATDLDERPGLGALLDRIESSGVRLVLIERADRLARDLMAGEIILADFRKHGVRVVSADGGIDTAEENPNDADAATRTLVRQVLGAVAQYDTTVTVSKLKAARQQMKRRTGRCEGRKPYGARPSEAETVLRMRALRNEGASYGQIARTLDCRGRPHADGAVVERDGEQAHPGADVGSSTSCGSVWTSAWAGISGRAA
jgi:DNA invertase Pin-like site-specific DNA recombinase